MADCRPPRLTTTRIAEPQNGNSGADAWPRFSPSKTGANGFVGLFCEWFQVPGLRTRSWQMGSTVLLDLMGGVALLLWGLHMVRSGIMRAFGSELRRALSTALRNRLLALLAGIGVTALLQSSTATGLLMTSFAARGLVALVPGLAVMLGANIGTTLIVQALSFDVSAAAPILFLTGLLAFNVGGRTRTRDLG